MAEIEKEYQTISQIIEIFQNKLQLSYFDALIEALGDILEKKINSSEDLDKSALDELKTLYHQIDIKEFSSEEIRQLIQLLLLNSYKKEAVQPNHQMTPDSIGYLVTFLMEKIVKKDKLNSILDIGVGTGNLLSVIMNSLAVFNKDVHGYGVDNDDTLLAIADVSFALQNDNVDLFHQDAIDEILIPKVDVVVGDLPVGYYPLDDRVKNYQTSSSEGHSFAHYLLIERALNQLKKSGWGFFIVPSRMFEDQNSQKLLKMIRNEGYLQGLLNLPSDMFVSKESQKAILIVQNKGQEAKQASQILLGDFPSLKHQKEFNKFLDEINLWVRQNLN